MTFLYRRDTSKPWVAIALLDFNATMSIIENYFNDYPALFAFITALVGNSIPYATIPYLVFFVSYGTLVRDPITLAVSSIAGGLGAAVGKLVVYYIGRGVNRVLPEKSKHNLTVFTRSFSKSIFIIVFLFAALPLPDDVIYLPLGVAGYSVVKFFVAVALGKIVITFASLSFGVFVAEVMQEHSLLTMLSALIAGILLSVLVAKIDWERVVKEYQSRGWLGLTQALLAELARLALSWKKG